MSTITPKNPPSDKENIYTDPKLLEMIRKDLEDINKLKQSGIMNRLSNVYPKTDYLLNSSHSPAKKACQTDR